MYERASSIQARILCLMWQPPHVISLSDYVLTRRLCHSLQHNLARSVTSLSLMKSAHSRAEPDCSFGNLDVTVTNHNNLCAKGVTHMMCDVEEENAISSFDKEHIISSSNLTAASELCERLTTLTERWECELMFHEIPPDTRHRLLLMDPNSPSLHEFVDLCKYMDKKTGLRDRLESSFPTNAFYRFPHCYKGLHNHALLQSQLLIAAERSCYSICIRNSVKGALKEKSKMLFVCRHGRKYEERFGRSKPDKLPMERCTSTHRSLHKEECCPFSFTVFHYAFDDYWYLSNYRKVRNNCDPVNVHRFHPKLLTQGHITPSLKSMDAVSLGIAKHAATLHISQSITSMLLQQTTTQHWLPEQLRYISKQAKKLMGNDDSSTGTSSADRLLAYLKKQSDVSYITLCDIPGSTLVSERGKGRPRKDVIITTQHNDLTNAAPANVPHAAHEDAQRIRDSLKVSDDQRILLAVAWATDREKKFAQKFPEVLFVDATSSTNVEKRELVLVCGKDSNNSGFTAMRVFVPSEKQWVYNWLYNDAIPTLLGHVCISQNKLVLTDGDRNNYGPLENCISSPTSCWATSSHGLCEWHLLGQSWQRHVMPTIQKMDSVKCICVTAISWIKSWFWDLENEAEFNTSKEQFLTWLQEKSNTKALPEVTFVAIRNLLINQLLPLSHKWARYHRHSSHGVMHDVTTSVVESQNSATKGNHSYSVKCQMTLDTSLETLTQFGRNYIDRKMQRSATQSSKTTLRSSLTSSSFLTDHASHVLSESLSHSANYYIYSLTATKWLVAYKAAIDSMVDCASRNNGDGYTKFARVRVITQECTANENILHVQCSCSYYLRVGLPCSHILAMCHNIEPSMCKVRWWKVYHYSYLNDDAVTQEIDEFISQEDKQQTSVVVTKENFNTSFDPPEDNVCNVMLAIHCSTQPIVYNGPYVTDITQLLENEEKNGFSLNEDNYFEPCSDQNYYGLQREVSITAPQSTKEGVGETYTSSQDRYHRCMAAVNETLKLCVESEDHTRDFIKMVENYHAALLQQCSTPLKGATVTCCLPTETRSSGKRRKTLGYI